MLTTIATAVPNICCTECHWVSLQLDSSIIYPQITVCFWNSFTSHPPPPIHVSLPTPFTFAGKTKLMPAIGVNYPYSTNCSTANLPSMKPSFAADRLVHFQQASPLPDDAAKRKLSNTTAASKLATSYVGHSQLSTDFIEPSSFSPRVTFRDRVDTITGISPNNSDPGSQNTSSNDSGIDTNRQESQQPLNTNPMGSGGQYDNAFPRTLSPPMLVRSVSQPAGATGPEAAPTLFVGNMSRQSESPTYSRMQSEPGKGQIASHPTKQTGQLPKLGEMIGDTGTSFASSNSDQLSLLLSSCLLAEDTNETRLCSQV